MSIVTTMLLNVLIFWARHALFAIGAGLLAWLSGPAGRTRPIQPARPGVRQIAREMLWSGVTGAIFAGVGGLILFAALHGYTRIYWDISSHGWTWFFTSIACSVLAHDAYFYWTHRWRHEWAVLRPAHRLHHEFTNPTPWAAFAFHPTEALIEAGVMPLLAFILPLHPLAIFAFTTLVTAQSVAIHWGHEVLPPRAAAPRLAWMGSRPHNDHHAGTRGNYGLYFTLWDVAMGTYVPSARDTARPA